MKIHQLPPHIVAKIAAGEVIERPAYAVKELIDNAIDAGADEISIYIQESGLKKIQVIDNGEGMSKEDLVESVKPHTTSKISANDELLGIKTLGFRGEALASLAAVSNLTIKSRVNSHLFFERSSPMRNEVEKPKNSSSRLASPRTANWYRAPLSRTINSNVGYQIIVKNGEVIAESPVGMPEGTIVMAENLFANIPARKKFLKSPQTELRHIIDVVSNFALSFPNIRFSLAHNNKTIFDFSKNQSLEERIKKILGDETFSHFLPVKNIDSYLTIDGYIAKPQLNTLSQSKQYIFINSRRVTDKLTSLAVKESFGTMLESTTYPIFILFLSTPFEMVDVNIHPRKEHVAFINQKTIFETIKNSVLEVLQENNITFQNLSWKKRGVGTTDSFAANLLKESVLNKEDIILQNNSSYLQLHQTYIVLESKHGIVIFDQHAAHERILFEKFLKEFKKQTKKQKPFLLKTPITLGLSLTEQEILYEYKKIFEKLGFSFYSSSEVNKMNEVEKSKNSSSRLASPRTTNWYRASLARTIIVTYVPFLLHDRNPEEFIKEILEDLDQELPIKPIDTISIEMLSFLACRAAVKAGDILEKEQMKKIILELEKTPSNATCPHGRPTRIFFNKKDLDSMFGR